MSDTHKYLITITERQAEVLPELQRRAGAKSRSDLFRTALALVAETYGIAFPRDIVKPGMYKRKKL